MAFRLPTFIAPCSIWRWSNWLGTPPPAIAPDVTAFANLTPGRRVTGNPTAFDTFLLLPIDTDVRFSEDGTFTTFPASTPDLVEIPAGSARFYKVIDVDIVALGFANAHLIVSVEKVSPFPVTPPPATGELLLEDATDLLLEDGTFILLE